MIQAVPLALVDDGARFGGKAVSLGRSVRAGLPVPAGFALDVAAVDAVAATPTDAESLADILSSLGGRAAVRSSAIGEDSKDTSFAGQHVTILNVDSHEALVRAIIEVRQSAHSASAMNYRERMGIAGRPQISVVIQKLIDAESAGVLFTRNPITGENERLIEAAWGLGEAVVSGAVVPDSYRISCDGQILERCVGEKHIALRLSASGGTTEVALHPSQARALVLQDEQLRALHELTTRCETVFGTGLDIEWAYESGRLYLLQCRSITRSGPRPE